MIRSLLTMVAAAAWIGAASVGQALAQEPTEPTFNAPTSANIGFEVGEFNNSLGDWPIVAVNVTGGIDNGTPITVILSGKGGRELWRGSVEFKAPMTTLPVTGVTVHEVEQARFDSSAVLGQLIVPELDKPTASGGGSSGQVATSMSLVIIVAVILFRTPLPAAATQRWTK